MALTDRTLKNAKPRETVYRLRDSNSVIKGFGVTIAPAGSKTFFLSYTAPQTGKRTQVNIGRYPAVSRGDARDKALAFRQKLSLGIDPKDEIKRQKKQEEELATRPTLAALFDTYIADLEMDGKRSAKEVRRIFDKHITECIGDTIAAEVTTDDILDVLTPS